MSDFSDKIRRINVLQKLLLQERISLNKNLGDPEVVAQINELLKAHIQTILANEFGKDIPVGIVSATIVSQFSEDEVAILKEFAGKVINGAKQALLTPEVVQPMAPPARKPRTPLEMAMQQNPGFNQLSPEARKAELKKVEEMQKWAKGG